MPIYRELSVSGHVDAILCRPTGRDSIVSDSLGERVDLTLDGVPGETHSGATRGACVRVNQIFEKGHKIRNTRQISIISTEEMAQIAETLDIPKIEPDWLGANILISGIPHFSLLPPSSRLVFSSGAVVVVDLFNGPCIHPQRVIEEHHPGHGKGFIKAAQYKRGIVGWVEGEGELATGDTIKVFSPNQPAYPES